MNVHSTDHVRIPRTRRSIVNPDGTTARVRSGRRPSRLSERRAALAEQGYIVR